MQERMGNALNKLRSLDRYTKFAIIIILIGIIMRFVLALPYHVAGDGCWHISNARFIANNYKIPLYEPLGRDQPFWSPPLFHIVSAVFYRAFGLFGIGAADFGIKLVSPLFSSLALIFSYLILKNLFDKKAAFYGTLFATFLPISIDYGVFSYADSMLTFFILASVYYALKNKILISALSLSLAILTKYTGLVIIPVIIYIIFIKSSKSFLRKSAVMLAITAAVSSLWYIRNWAYLKNPVYPVLNSLFNGIEVGTTYSGFDFSRLFSINSIIFPFLEFFGVPDGNPSNIFFYNVPFLSAILAIWLISILLFILPIFFGLRINKETRNIAIVWMLGFLLAGVLHILNVGWSIGRRLLPITIILAFFWGNGIKNITKKTGHGIIIFSILALIIGGFVAVEIAKVNLAADSWGLYQDDFSWVKQNTEKDAVFMAGGQCLSYNINKFSYQDSPDNLEKVKYAWVNQDFRLDKRVIMDASLLSEIRSRGEIVYRNEKTKTEIYRLKQ